MVLVDVQTPVVEGAMTILEILSDALADHEPVMCGLTAH
jgi:hypothetical protein